MAKRKTIEAALDAVPEILLGCAASGGEAEFIEAAAEDGKKLKKFSGVAYTGVPMSVGYGYPVALDLTGIVQGGAQIPALRDHDSTQIVGHLSAEIGKRQIKVAGVLSGDGVTEAAAEVSALSANDFPWQMSVGVAPTKLEFVERNESVNVNGRKVEGPAYVVRAGVLREVSFVAMGADHNTSSQVAASIQRGDESMNPFDKWLEAAGFDRAKLSASQLAKLQASYDAEQAAEQAKQARPEPVQAAAQVADPTEAIRAKAAAELDRQAKVAEVAKDHPAIHAQAVREGWDATRTELEVLRASRPRGPAIHTGANDVAIGNDVLTAGLHMALGVLDEKQHKPEVLQAAHSTFRKRLSIKRLLSICAAANGMALGAGETIDTGNLEEALRFAFTPVRGAFSTLSLPYILENAANKLLLQGYMEVDQTWREISEVVALPDFKTSKGYRLLDSMEYEELSPAGQIAHGEVSEETISRSIDTYAKMFAITRRNIIDDDLNAFATLPRRLGQGAAKKFNSVFWAAFINNSSFFTTNRTNYITGATTTLLTDGVGLGLAIKAFRQMTSPSADGAKLIGADVEPRILLVPPELEGAATALYAANNISNAANGSGNIYYNRFRPVVQSRLSNSAFTGYSATAWYLFGDMMKPMWAGFLNGNESPTVESAQADFDTLGIQFRGYHDFGAGQNEYLAGVKSKGAA